MINYEDTLELKGDFSKAEAREKVKVLKEQGYYAYYVKADLVKDRYVVRFRNHHKQNSHI